ncbi:hypothetical protein AB0D67_09120 [Streptosporangium sp. NPDC048047]|uniref:hypothetical protein n=1 Tax=Streptosporangium sp. NPDC048047 TaxID=3155748 RepID=UPI00343A95C0
MPRWYVSPDGQSAGRPAVIHTVPSCGRNRMAFGLTVTPGRQYVWLGDPDGPSWGLPA